MIKKTLFQLHWLLGISAGLVLALMGVTGATLSFQDELVRLFNPGVLSVEVPAGAQPLSPQGLVARLAEQVPERQVLGMTLSSEPGAAAKLQISGDNPRGETVYADPYTGELLGAAGGEGFFQFVMQLHRWLAMGDTGQAITGASTLGLIFLCLSGLYLRWPRRAGSWRAWLALDWRQKGRGFVWNLHAVAGTWVLVCYLLASLTGLYWSYDWYRSGLTALAGETRSQGKGKGGAPRAAKVIGPVQHQLDGPWQGFNEAVQGNWRLIRMNLPAVPGNPLQLRYVAADAPHDWAFSQMQIAADGKVIAHNRFADKSTAAQLLGSVYPLHTGAYFGTPGRIILFAASLAMPLFFITGWQLYLGRRRSRREARLARGVAASNAHAGGAPWLVLYASQNGFAERLAWQTAGQLQAAGTPAEVRCLGKTDPAMLQTAERALFVVSTFGDGEAPDSARGFVRQVLAGELDLSHLRYAVLGVGDRQYQRFCGFARQLQGWLERQGAQAFFAPVDVHQGDPSAIEQWRQQLGKLHGGAVAPLAVTEPAFGEWTLLRHACLNPGSSAEPVYALHFAIPAGERWQAGDLVEVQPPQAGAMPRRYSIASVVEEGTLMLLVRLHRRADGSAGLCSGWLAGLAPGAQVPLRVCANAGFHLPADDRPLLLIGNGTGLAGLRALLKQRMGEGRQRNWLIFGERTRAQDFLCGEELLAWQASGELERLDLAFSRDQGQKVYVQDRLCEAGDALRAWLADGAAIYVCGSLQGMGEGVETALREQLGEAELERLREAGRYRRDLY